MTTDTHKHVEVVDPRRAWALLTVYWTIGWITGLWRNYLSYWTLPSLTWFHGAALISTLVLQHHLNEPLTNFGRRTDFITVGCFAIGNGLAETMFFLASYDYGRIVMARRMELTTNQAIIMGYTTHFFYRAVIQTFFWSPSIFPRHVRPDAPPYLTHTLPAQILRAMVLLSLYELHGEVGTICLLHIVSDAWWASNVALPSLFGV
jgi:hypothetical protein